MKIKISKKLMIVGGVAIVLLVGIIFAFVNKKGSVTTTLTKVAVSRGDIVNTISGSGTVQPIEEYEIVALVKGDILSDNVTIGQTVNAGDFLYSIDSTDAENSIRKAEIALEKQELTYSQTKESVENLKIYSTISGRIANLYVEEGDSVNSNSKIADIINSDVLLVKLPFNKNDAQNIKVGDAATVYLESTGESFSGNVVRVSTGSYASSTGALVSDIEISFNNPGAVTNGQMVTAVVGNFACNSVGTTEYKDKLTITSKTSGTVEKLNFSEGDKVSKGALLLTLENDSAVINEQSGALSLQDSQIALQDSKNDLNNYYITSPISGTVIDKYYKAGDTLDGNRTTLAVIADMSKLSFTMSIDELDIKNISVGQEVEITADALTGVEFVGHITEISIIGNSSSGVTTYPVTVVIEEYEGLMPGMNVNADIISEKAENAIRVPVSAVTRGDVVLVSEDYANSLTVNTSAQGSEETDKRNNKNTTPGQIVEMPNTKDGYKYIKVTTGISDDDFIEIKEGLDDNAEVYVLTTVSSNKSSETSTTSSTAMTGGMMMGGGMPTGGAPMEMPSGNGGNFSGNRSSGNTGRTR